MAASRIALLLARLRAQDRPRGGGQVVPSPWDAEPMLAQHSLPFSREGWLFEVKYDGFRMLAGRHRGRVRLRYRGGTEATPAFPEIAAALAEVPLQDFVLDGEVVVVDAEGRPSFQRLQRRFQGGRRGAARAAAAHPAVYFAFDILAADGCDLRALPLVERKAILRAAVPPRAPALAYVDHLDAEGEALFAEARRLGLEGVVGKRADAPYVHGRSREWRKVRVDRTGDFVIVGWTPPGLGLDGGMHLAARVDGVLVYAGRVGGGFEAGVLEACRGSLAADRRPTPPCVGAVPRGRGHTWVEPRVVCEVRYKERTDAGLLRQPVFLRFRPDLEPSGLD